MTMTSSRTVTRFTAFAAALVLALSMIALATTGATGGDLQIVPASHFGDEDHGPPNDPPCGRDKGAPAENNPNCDEDREKGKDDKDKDKGPPNDPPCKQGKAGEKNPNCKDDDNGKTPQEQCEEDGGTWNEDTEECEFEKTPQEQCEEDGGTWNEDTEECEFEKTPQEQCEEDGGTWNEDTEECEFDDGERCGPGDGLDLTDSGTIAKEMHNNDPTGLSNDPDATGLVSQEVYDGSQDTPLEDPLEEVACLANLATL